MRKKTESKESNKSVTKVVEDKEKRTTKKKKKHLYFVYWNYDRRKCLVDGKDEEDAKEHAKRFAGKYANFSRVEKTDVEL